MNWEFISEVNLHLTETELRYYGDIFLYCCDSSDPDSVPVVKAAELFHSANLQSDVMIKIFDICAGPKENNYMNRKQFYTALKLVSAYQSGLDINNDLTINSFDVSTPLPRFSWPTSSDEADTIKINNNNINNINKNNKDMKIGIKRLPGSTTESESDVESSRDTGGSTDSPTPTNSVTQERIDELMGSEKILDTATGSWRGLLVSEEQRQLLGTEEESSERHSSDEGDGEQLEFLTDEIWAINDEQKDYYAAQFTKLQPDPDGLIAGSIARTFFEKSRLPVAELRKIWQLADVTRDGALSRLEFFVAMHLVVLRRNHVALPDVLPPILSIPLEMSISEINNEQKLSPASAPASLPVTIPVSVPVPVPPLPPSTSSSPSKKLSINKNKEWTKFVDSPTGTNGSLTSPGPKPVNFDFQKTAVERDPKILHPVPLRLTPEAAILASSANNNANINDEDIHTVNLVQRPIAKKTIQINDDIISGIPKKEPPPPPPPRPYRTHTRSSSLDLNKLGKNGQTFLGTPPSVPPRASPGTSSPRKLIAQKSECDNSSNISGDQGFIADFSQFTKKNNENMNCVDAGTMTQTQKFAGSRGAFHIYKKPSPKPGDDDDTKKIEADDERPMTLEELRDKNSELRLVCEELTRELAGALQERINLRAKLLLIT